LYLYNSTTLAHYNANVINTELQLASYMQTLSICNC